MGTKKNPGAFDCYANAAPDEPMFILLARDHKSAPLVREWAERYRRQHNGYVSDKYTEALAVADAMDAYRATLPAKAGA